MPQPLALGHRMKALALLLPIMERMPVSEVPTDRPLPDGTLINGWELLRRLKLRPLESSLPYKKLSKLNVSEKYVSNKLSHL